MRARSFCMPEDSVPLRACRFQRMVNSRARLWRPPKLRLPRADHFRACFHAAMDNSCNWQRLPQMGEAVEFGNWRFEAVDLDARCSTPSEILPRPARLD